MSEVTTPVRQVRIPRACRQFKAGGTLADGWRDRSPQEADHRMSKEITEPPPMRMGGCPFCERTVLVYEEPPRCPICACPLEESSMRPFVLPSDQRPAETD